MTTQQRFNAAVNVIRNLPKNGSYQPSNDLMLSFYGYYKQATEGWEDRGSRPPFWDVVRRAKYDAWAKLGQMSKEEAMNKYVEQLNKIVETMALTDNVANFLTSLDTYAGNAEDLELSIGPTLEKVRSLPGSPVDSRDTSPNRARSSPASTQSSPRVSFAPPDADDEDDDFLDSVEDADNFDIVKNHKKKESHTHHIPNGVLKNHKPKLPNGYTTMPTIQTDVVDEALQRAIESLRRDLSSANEKVKSLEEKQSRLSKKSSRISIWNMTRGTTAFLILWPVFAYFILNRLTRRRLRQ